MKVIFIFGDGASGKMTVGQELSKLIHLPLFHNHQMIEPVLEIHGFYKKNLVHDLRMVVFKDFATSECDGLITTLQFDFNLKDDYEYIKEIQKIFLDENDETEFYFVELDCELEERLRRNKTPNRLEHKPSKKNIEYSELQIYNAFENHRCESVKSDNIPWKNFLKIDNTKITAKEAAEKIVQEFNLA